MHVIEVDNNCCARKRFMLQCSMPVISKLSHHLPLAGRMTEFGGSACAASINVAVTAAPNSPGSMLTATSSTKPSLPGKALPLPLDK